MQIEVGLPSEGFATLCTLIRLFPSMVPDMLLQVGGVLEGLSAVLTLIGPLPSVCPLVSSEVAAPAVGFAALIAFVRSFSSMNSHVYLQSRGSPEGVTTLTAVEGLLFQVSSCVVP